MPLANGIYTCLMYVFRSTVCVMLTCLDIPAPYKENWNTCTKYPFSMGLLCNPSFGPVHWRSWHVISHGLHPFHNEHKPFSSPKSKSLGKCLKTPFQKMVSFLCCCLVLCCLLIFPSVDLRL